MIPRSNSLSASHALAGVRLIELTHIDPTMIAGYGRFTNGQVAPFMLMIVPEPAASILMAGMLSAAVSFRQRRAPSRHRPTFHAAVHFGGQESRSSLRTQRIKRLLQALNVDGLHQMLIEARFVGAFAVFGLAVSADRDEVDVG